MVASRAAKVRAPRHRLPAAEKRRIIELMLRDDTSIRAIAREHGVSRNTLRRWQELYRAGKLAEQPAPSGAAGVPGATFLPVTIAPAARAPRVAAIPRGICWRRDKTDPVWSL